MERKEMTKEHLSDDFLNEIIEARPDFYVDKKGEKISAEELRNVLNNVTFGNRPSLLISESEYYEYKFKHLKQISLQDKKKISIYEIYDTYKKIEFKFKIPIGDGSHAKKELETHECDSTVCSDSSTSSQVDGNGFSMTKVDLSIQNVLFGSAVVLLFFLISFYIKNKNK